MPDTEVDEMIQALATATPFELGHRARFFRPQFALLRAERIGFDFVEQAEIE